MKTPCYRLLVISLLAAACAACAARADEYDALRLKWQDFTVGTGYNPSDADVKTRLNSISNSARSAWASMDTSPTRTFLWSDAASTTVSAHLTTSYGRLRSMALAYATPGCLHYGSAALLADTVSGLGWMNTNRYNTTIARYDNWWDWQIGVPLHLTDIAVLLYDPLTAAQRTAYMAAVNFHTPIPDMTQANLIWKARVVGVRGCVVKDAAKLTLARDAFSAVFPYVTSGDGFYRDGSFIQHTFHPYIGGYGAALLSNMAPLMTWLSGSTWAVTDPAQTNLYHWVYDSIEPLIYRGACWDFVRGREVSRSSSSPQGTGHTFLQNILRISQFAPPADAARMRSMVKYWAQSDAVRNFVGTVPLTLLADAKALMADAATLPRGELIGHYHFGKMDRVIHLRPGYGFGLGLSSSRIANFESINSENLRGWHAGDGMTVLYNGELSHYGDAYWATIDPYRLPGTTVDTKTLTPPSNPTRANGQSTCGIYAWTGGAALGTLGAVGMQLDAIGVTLTAKKSWFMFDDEIVCLGAGITSTDNRTIETVVENRRLLTANATNAFTAGGLAMPSTLGWSATLAQASWAHLAGSQPGSDIGYHFPQPVDVRALREARTGTWNDVNAGGSTSPITRNYLTLWLDHGSNPVGATYAYTLLPAFAASNVAAYAANPDCEILENSARAQGVRERTLGVTAVNFWQPGVSTVGGITVNRPCSVLVRDDGTWLDVAVADPTQTNTSTITVEVDVVATCQVSLDEGVTLTRLSPTVQLAVKADNKDGRSYRASFFRGVVSTQALASAADTYVENGDNANNNYGTSQSLVVKYTTSGKQNRESYLRFDLTALTNGILVDAAVRLVYTQSNGADTHIAASVLDHIWTETGLVWTNKPVASSELARWSIQTNLLPTAVIIPAGAAVKAALGGVFDLKVSAASTAYVSYASRENTTVSNRPQLILTYAHPPPKVALTAPSAGTTLHWTGGLTLTADASAEGGDVTGVAFYDGLALLGQCAAAPYAWAATNLAPGTHTFTAVAVESGGASAASAPIAVTVTGAPIAVGGRVVTLADTPTWVDLRLLVRAYATPPDALHYGVAPITGGAVAVQPDRTTARFEPAPGFTGSASFRYTVTDRGVDPRLFLYYDMEQADGFAGGTINDASGNGRDGTLETVGSGEAAPTNHVPSHMPPGRALRLQERGDFNGARLIRAIATAELNFNDHDWSFSGWFWRTALTNDDFIFYLGNGDGFGSNEELHLYGVGGSSELRLQHYIGQVATDINLSAGHVALGEWHHVALTFVRTHTASGVMALYLDGELKGTADSFTLSLDQTSPLVFGGHKAANFAVTRWFNGLLDDLAVYDVALDASEIAALATRSAAHLVGPAATQTVEARVLAPDETPALSTVARAADGAWSMTIVGPTSFGYVVEASTNLTEWLPLETVTPPSLPFEWSDSAALLYPQRFYRVRLTP